MLDEFLFPFFFLNYCVILCSTETLFLFLWIATCLSPPSPYFRQLAQWGGIGTLLINYPVPEASLAWKGSPACNRTLG